MVGMPTLADVLDVGDPTAHVESPVRYRYLLTDLLTGLVLSEARTLTLSSYSRRLADTADASATLEVSAELSGDPVAATEPRRTALWIIRNEVVVWGGIIWTRKYTSETETFELGASTFESYLARRRIRSTFNYLQADQHTILWDLFRRAALVAYGNIGIQIGSAAPAPSGVLRDRTYYWYERATYLERIQQLAQVIGGPDFTLDPGWLASGAPAVTLHIGTPLGAPSGVQIIEYPGEVRSYTWPDDGGDSANFWSAIGDADPAVEDGPPLIRDASMPSEWAAGVPLLEDVSSHDGVIIAATLTDYAKANVQAASGNRVVPEVTLRLPPDATTLPGMGDTLQLRVTDPFRFPAQPSNGAPGLAANVRVLGWTVNVGSDGETITLELGEAF
jgi:hypothetical protein